MTKTALITGITGQDGGHLAALLHEKGYKVYGVLRGQSELSHPRCRDILEAMPFLNLVLADLLDLSALVRTMQDIRPDEVYNLAAISHVGYSFRDPVLTADVTGKGVLNMLEAIRLAGLDKTRFYQASTSEMYGGLEYNRPKKGYNEDSTFHPRSPYGVAKLYGHWITRNYREAYGMYAVSGILFNHEGERRGPEFVTRKISRSVARIKLGLQECIELGNMDSMRDWGYAGDYVEGMWRMLQQDKEPKDYVLATGEVRSVREFCEVAFKHIGVNLKWQGKGVKEQGVDTATGKVRVKINPEYFRPAEVDFLLGDPSRAEKELGWKRKVDFTRLVQLMVDHDLRIEGKKT